MCRGDLQLEFDGELHFYAQITSWVNRGNELVFDFEGKDAGFKYTGNCRLFVENGTYTGQGLFIYDNVKTPARIIATFDESESVITGVWQDDGDAEHYDLTVYLS